MPSFITNAVQVQRFADALYNVAVGTSTMAQVTADITASGGLDNALNAYYSSSFTGVPTATVAANMCTNLGIVAGQNGLVAADVTNAQNYIVGTLNAAAANARGAAVKAILSNLSSLASDKVYGAVATKFNSDIDKATLYTGASDIVAGSIPTPVLDTTFKLTASADNFTGTTGNDVFDASLNSTGTVTFQTFDRLDGGAGNDTLTTVGVGSLTLSSTTISNIENLEFIGQVASTTIDLSAITGVQTIKATNPAAGAHTISGIASGITSLSVAGMNTNSDSQTFTLQNAALSGATDNLLLNLQSSVPTAASSNNVTITMQPTSGTNGAETFSIVSSGGSNGDPAGTSSGTITLDDGTSTSLTTVNISGTSTARLVFTPATITRIDASANTAGVGLTLATGTNTNINITGTSGADNFVLGATFDKSDTIAGGSGTDTLNFDVNNSNFSYTDALNVTSIETLRLATTALGGNLNLSNFGDTVTTVRLDIALAADRSITNLPNAAVIDIRDLASQTLTAVMKDATGANDSITFNLRSTMATAGATTDTMTGLVAAGVENITISSGAGDTPDNAGDQNIITGMTTAGAKNYTITGNVGLNLGTLGAAVTSVDSTALTPQVSSTTAGDGGLIVVLATPSNVPATIRTGSGNDSITGGSGDETIVTGNGVDTVDIGTNGGIDNVDTGSGNDIIIVASANLGTTSTTFDTINGGDGTDILRVSATGTFSDSQFTRLSNLERIDAGSLGAQVNLNLGSNAAAAFTSSAIRIDQGATALLKSTEF